MSRSDRPVQFGANECSHSSKANPSTVDSSWHASDYRPAPRGNNGEAPRTCTKAPSPQPPVAEPAGTGHDQEQDTTTPPRRAAARVVANMETSPALPTATNVRAVPAKLLVDNRIVINNHLKRARSGKVSFTYLIGYAAVRALADFPQMNGHYTTDNRGKSAVVAPEHVKRGLAIDLKTGKGPQPVVTSIKGGEVMAYPQQQPSANGAASEEQTAARVVAQHNLAHNTTIPLHGAAAASHSCVMPHRGLFNVLANLAKDLFHAHAAPVLSGSVVTTSAPARAGPARTREAPRANGGPLGSRYDAPPPPRGKTPIRLCLE